VGIEARIDLDRDFSEKKSTMQNPFEFLQEVRAEGSKVTWPTRRETIVTTIMVFVFTAFASIFFLVVDQVLAFTMSTFLNFLR